MSSSRSTNGTSKKTKAVLIKELNEAQLLLIERNDALEECRDELRKALTAMESISLDVDNPHSGREIAALRADIEKSQKEAERLKNELDTAVKNEGKLAPKIKKLETGLQAARGETERLNNRIGELKNENTALNTRVGELKSENDVLNTRVNELQSEAEGSNTRISDLQSENEALNSRVSELQTGNEGADTRISGLKSENDALNNRVSELQSENDALNSRISELQTGNEGSSTRISRLQSESKALNTRVSMLQSENDALNNHVSELQTGNKGLNNRVSELQTENEGLSVKLQELQEKMEKVEEETRAAQNDETLPVSSASFRIDLYPRDHDEYRGKIEHLFSGKRQTFSGLDSDTIMEFIEANRPKESATDIKKDNNKKKRADSPQVALVTDKKPVSDGEPSSDSEPVSDGEPAETQPIEHDSAIDAVPQGVTKTLPRSEVLFLYEDTDLATNTIKRNVPFTIDCVVDTSGHEAMQKLSLSALIYAKRLNDGSSEFLGKESLYKHDETHLRARLSQVTLDSGMYRIETILRATSAKGTPAPVSSIQESELLYVT